MKTLTYKNLRNIKYFIFLIAISFISCSFDECGAGPAPPPPPVINVTYSSSGSSNAKFFQESNERLSINSISVEMTSESSSIYIDNMNFGYPYLIINANEKHLIKEYNNIQHGQKWTFTFNGLSLTTGINFSVTSSIHITN